NESMLESPKQIDPSTPGSQLARPIRNPSDAVSSGTFETCQVCNDAVYPTECLLVERRLLHPQCLKCRDCGRPLRVSDYNKFAGHFYCKPHFDRLVRTSQTSPVRELPPSSASLASIMRQSLESLGDNPRQFLSRGYRDPTGYSPSQRLLAQQLPSSPPEATPSAREFPITSTPRPDTSYTASTDRLIGLSPYCPVDPEASALDTLPPISRASSKDPFRKVYFQLPYYEENPQPTHIYATPNQIKYRQARPLRDSPPKTVPLETSGRARRHSAASSNPLPLLRTPPAPSAAQPKPAARPWFAGPPPPLYQRLKSYEEAIQRSTQPVAIAGRGAHQQAKPKLHKPSSTALSSTYPPHRGALTFAQLRSTFEPKQQSQTPVTATRSLESHRSGPQQPLRCDTTDALTPVHAQGRLVAPVRLQHTQSKPQLLSQNPYCASCGRRCSLMDQLVYDQMVYHPSCFRCCKCSRLLTSRSCQKAKDRLWCLTGCLAMTPTKTEATKADQSARQSALYIPSHSTTQLTNRDSTASSEHPVLEPDTTGHDPRPYAFLTPSPLLLSDTKESRPSTRLASSVPKADVRVPLPPTLASSPNRTNATPNPPLPSPAPCTMVTNDPLPAKVPLKQRPSSSASSHAASHHAGPPEDVDVRSIDASKSSDQAYPSPITTPTSRNNSNSSTNATHPLAQEHNTRTTPTPNGPSGPNRIDTLPSPTTPKSDLVKQSVSTRGDLPDSDDIPACHTSPKRGGALGRRSLDARPPLIASGVAHQLLLDACHRVLSSDEFRSLYHYIKHLESRTDLLVATDEA
ncbi:Xin actin-binding repeat-containing protein 2, partial [Dimargaris xerosporica]